MHGLRLVVVDYYIIISRELFYKNPRLDKFYIQRDKIIIVIVSFSHYMLIVESVRDSYISFSRSLRVTESVRDSVSDLRVTGPRLLAIPRCR